MIWLFTSKKNHRNEFCKEDTENVMDANEEQNSTEISGAENQHEEFEREKYPNKEDNEGDDNQCEFQ